MSHHSVHMRDQKANQMAMLAKTDREMLINIVEELVLIVGLWAVFILATLN